MRKTHHSWPHPPVSPPPLSIDGHSFGHYYFDDRFSSPFPFPFPFPPIRPPSSERRSLFDLFSLNSSPSITHTIVHSETLPITNPPPIPQKGKEAKTVSSIVPSFNDYRH